MSNTSTVNPADGAGVVVGAAAACVVGAVVGSAAVIRWLNHQAPEERAYLNARTLCMARNSAEAARATRPAAGGGAVEFAAVQLHATSADGLVQTAAKMGYRAVPEPSAQRPGAGAVHLVGAAGERLSFNPTPEGRVVAATNGGVETLQKVVRLHTVTRTLAHLERAGMAVRHHPLPNGEVQILAREKTHAGAELKAQVGRDGKTWVDVSGVRGRRCEDLVRDLARGVDGKVAQVKKKESYYQMPGEPARVGVGAGS